MHFVLLLIALIAAPAHAQSNQEECEIVLDKTAELCKIPSIAAKARQIYDLNNDLLVLRMIERGGTATTVERNPMLSDENLEFKESFKRCAGAGQAACIEAKLDARIRVLTEEKKAQARR